MYYNKIDIDNNNCFGVNTKMDLVYYFNFVSILNVSYISILFNIFCVIQYNFLLLDSLINYYKKNKYILTIDIKFYYLIYLLQIHYLFFQLL